MARASEDTVGVSVFQGSKDYLFLRLHIHTPQLKRLGNPKKLSIRGQPANGFIIAPDPKGLSVRPIGAGKLVYLATAISNFELSRRARRAVHVRPQFENGHMRLPPLPPAWINAEEEFAATAKDEAPPATPPGVGRREGTFFLPKAAGPAYELPPAVAKDVDILTLQAQLATKLDEARAIIRTVEQRTGLKFILDRHLRLVVALPAA